MSQTDNHIIKESIQRIAMHGMMDKKTGTFKDLNRVGGYVVAVSVDDSGAHTVDVQEYVPEQINEDGIRIGLHKGVRLGALENLKNGFVLVPTLYSDVVIVTDPATKTEYVSMFSNVDSIQLKSHQQVFVGVVEVEEFDADDDTSPDVEDLPPTGVEAGSTYGLGGIVTKVATKIQQSEEAANEVTVIETKGNGIDVDVMEKASEVHIDQEHVLVRHQGSEMLMTDEATEMRHDEAEVVMKEGKTYVGSSSDNENAVLGVQLADFLIEFLQGMTQLLTPTQMGPQPPTNMATFINLMSKCQQFKATQSGFLTQNVFIQK